MTNREIIERRMASGEPFTFGGLWNQPGLTHNHGERDPYREADAAIQRWRKRGWIRFVRCGREVIWSLTDAGREAHTHG